MYTLTGRLRFLLDGIKQAYTTDQNQHVENVKSKKRKAETRGDVFALYNSHAEALLKVAVIPRNCASLLVTCVLEIMNHDKTFFLLSHFSACKSSKSKCKRKKSETGVRDLSWRIRKMVTARSGRAW